MSEKNDNSQCGEELICFPRSDKKLIAVTPKAFEMFLLLCSQSEKSFLMKYVYFSNYALSAVE